MKKERIIIKIFYKHKTETSKGDPLERLKVKKIVRQALPMLLLTGFFNLGAGSILGGVEEQLGQYLPGMLIMVPPLMDLKGNITGALASRLGSGLHQGLINKDKMVSSEVRTNVYAALTLGVMTATAIGVMATFITVLIMGETFTFVLMGKLVSVALLAAFLSVLFLTLVSVGVSIFSYRRGWDPDNITSPVLTTLGDILTLASLYIALLVVLTVAGSI